MTHVHRKKKPRYGTWRNVAWMIRYACVTPHCWPILILCFGTSAIHVGINLLELFVTPTILAQVETQAPMQALLTTILLFCLGLMALYGLRTYMNANFQYYKISVRLGILLDCGYKENTTAYPNKEDPAVQKKLEKAHEATGDNHHAGEMTWHTLQDLTRDVAGFIIYLCLLNSVDPVLLLVVTVTTVAGYFASKRIHEWGYRHREEEAGYQQRMGYVLNRCADQALAKELRIFSMQPWLESVYESASRLYKDFRRRENTVYLWGDALDMALSLLRGGVCYGYLLAMTLREGLPASQFLLYFSAINGFSAWISGILGGLVTLHTQSLELSAIREYIDMPEPFLFEDGKPLHSSPTAPHELRLEHVSFRYPGAKEDTIHDLCLTIHSGEKVALLGLNGAGKTTLVKLLCGFYDPTEGAVLLDGQDIRQFNRRDYYGLFTAVFQQFSLLEATVAENISQQKDVYDEAKLWACLESAGIAEKIRSLPGQEKAHLGREVWLDGVNLSGGQTQRLMLARALYKDAPILILDEPTAALDPIAESDLYQKYNEMARGRTSLFISHRLASTRFCDRILFLEHGVIAEEGTHETLLRKNGKYAELFAIQSKYYQEHPEGGEPDEEA